MFLKKIYIRVLCLYSAPKRFEPDTIEEAFAQGKVWLLYQKTNGKVGEYIGTRKASLIPKEFAPKGGERKEDQLPYYNLKEGNKGWKSISYLKGKVLDWQFIG